MTENALTVTPAEAGQKLLQFLARRFDTPPTVLHRWIRTGQVRINGGRAQPFNRLNEADVVRVPPFAGQDARGEHSTLLGPDAQNAPAASRVQGVPATRGVQARSAASGPHAARGSKRFANILATSPSSGLEIARETESVLICIKPAGLPVHAGTGHTDSLTARLQGRYAGSAFMPTPAHRLDKATSGLLLVAKTYNALRSLHEALAGHERVIKTYLAWVRGACPWTEPVLLEDRLEKRPDANGRERVCVVSDQDANGRERVCVVSNQDANGRERVHVVSDQSADGRESVCAVLTQSAGEYGRGGAVLGHGAGGRHRGHAASGQAEEGKLARLTAQCLEQRQGASLLRLTLHTGRTHQIRAQLAGRGFPLIGDPKYGGPTCDQGLLLHAHGLEFAPDLAQALGLEPGEAAMSWPDWRGPWAVRRAE